MIQEDLDAILFVRVPQIPSSRTFGRYPVYDAEDYFHRAPLIHSQWQTHPSVPRSFPPPQQ